MKTLIRLLVAFVLTVVFVGFALAQPDPVPVVAYPALFLIPYLLGMVVHWLKKYVMEGMQLTFWKYLVINIGWTITSLIVGWSAVFAIYAANPAAFDTSNIGSHMIIFFAAIGADTLNSGGTKTKLLNS